MSISTLVCIYSAYTLHYLCLWGADCQWYKYRQCSGQGLIKNAASPGTLSWSCICKTLTFDFGIKRAVYSVEKKEKKNVFTQTEKMGTTTTHCMHQTKNMLRKMFQRK